MREFVRRVSRVCAGVDAAGRYDALEEDRVPDRVEAVDADCFPGLQAEGVEARGELADHLVGLAGGNGVFGVEGADVDLGVSVLGRGRVFLWLVSGGVGDIRHTGSSQS